MINKETTTLALKFVKKIVDGKITYEQRKFRNLKNEATATDIKAVADAIAAISDGQFEGINLTVENVLV